MVNSKYSVLMQAFWSSGYLIHVIQYLCSRYVHCIFIVHGAYQPTHPTGRVGLFNPITVGFKNITAKLPPRYERCSYSSETTVHITRGNGVKKYHLPVREQGGRELYCFKFR